MGVCSDSTAKASHDNFIAERFNMTHASPDPDVTAVFDRQTPELRAALLALRSLILDVAKSTPGTGSLVETLKWGQPAYLTQGPKSGTTIRIDAENRFGGDYALFVSCSTSLVDDWRERFPDFDYIGNRGVSFRLDAPFPDADIRHCIAIALTYHMRRN